MKNVSLGVAAVEEAVIGLGLVVVPVARVAGFALVALAIAFCHGAGIVGMLVYNASVASYFLWLGIQGEWVGQFLWPAVVVHTVMTVWNAWDFARGRGDASAAIRG